MKLYVKDGKVMFDYEGEQSDMFTYDSFGFRYLGKGKREFTETGDPNDDWQQLSAAVQRCEYAPVDIDEEIYTFMAEYKRKRDEFIAECMARRKAEEEVRRRTEEWELRKRRGCRGCSELRCVGADDYICRHTGAELDIENKPGYCGMVYVLFNYEPRPCEGCKYEVKEEGNEHPEADKHTA